jgi:hypothetical protein
MPATHKGGIIGPSDEFGKSSNATLYKRRRLASFYKDQTGGLKVADTSRNRMARHDLRRPNQQRARQAVIILRF